jgi:hypothetical protein
MNASLLAALILAAVPAWSQQVRVQVRSTLQTMAPAVGASAAVVRVTGLGSPSLMLSARNLTVPTLRAVPVVAAPSPVLAAPAAVQTETEVQQVAQTAPVQASLARLSSRLNEVQESGGDIGAGLDKAFDGSAEPSAAVHERPSDDVVQARRELKKLLKNRASSGAPLSAEEADLALRAARQLGLEVRFHDSDLAVTNNHWVGGPHVHIAGIHVPVQPGYRPAS